MALNLEGKKAIVAEVQEAANGALSAVVADARGVTVEAITVLCKQARENGVWMKVVRNTLARRAVEGTQFECVSDVFKGPSLIAFSISMGVLVYVFMTLSLYYSSIISPVIVGSQLAIPFGVLASAFILNENIRLCYNNKQLYLDILR